MDEVFPLDTKTVTAATEGQDFSFNIYDAYYAWKYGWYQFDIPVGNWRIQLSRKNDSITTPNCYTSFYTSEHTTAANKPVFAFCYTCQDAPVDDNTYYMNNQDSKKFMCYDVDYPDLVSTTVAAGGNDIRWKIKYISSGQYVIESVAVPGEFLAVPSSPMSSEDLEWVTATVSTAPARAKWILSSGANGGILFKSAYNNRWLTHLNTLVLTAGTLGSPGSDQYIKNTWRIVSIDYYGTTPNHIARELEGFL